MEYVDIYNEHKELTGERLPRNTKLPQGKYMQYVLALIRCQDHYLITRRTMDKKWAAGAWEVPGGGCMAGESSLEAVIREVMEETGLDITGHNQMIYSYRNEDLDHGDNYFMDIYLCSLDFSLADVTIEEDEVLDAKLATIDEISDLYNKDGFLHYKRILEALQIR